jgi:glycosyltransferase involved in cell wall biosynthesis
VHCAVDRSYLERSLTPVPDVPRLVSVGRLSREKGQSLLVDAVARLRAEGVPVELVVIGDGDLRAELEARAGDGVRFAGWLDNARVADEIVASRALVLPSFSEGLPVTLMEALALGRPVVTTAIAGIPELVQDGVNGWVVPPSSLDALVDAMREVLTTPVEELDRMGKAGATLVAEQHDAITEAAKLDALF